MSNFFISKIHCHICFRPIEITWPKTRIPSYCRRAFVPRLPEAHFYKQHTTLSQLPNIDSISDFRPVMGSITRSFTYIPTCKLAYIYTHALLDLYVDSADPVDLPFTLETACCFCIVPGFNDPFISPWTRPDPVRDLHNSRRFLCSSNYPSKWDNQNVGLMAWQGVRNDRHHQQFVAGCRTTGSHSTDWWLSLMLLEITTQLKLTQLVSIRNSDLRVWP